MIFSQNVLRMIGINTFMLTAIGPDRKLMIRISDPECTRKAVSSLCYHIIPCKKHQHIRFRLAEGTKELKFHITPKLFI